MIDQLIAALNQEVDLSAEEIADTLWLAMQMEQAVTVVDSMSRTSQESKLDSENIVDKSGQRSKQELSNKSEPKTAKSQPKSTEELIDEFKEKPQKEKKAELYHKKPDKSQKSLEIPFKVPDAPSLREQLDLARALRPLMRRIPSGSTLVLDEAATTQRIADEGIWIPLLRPTLEPWLDLELVVDEGISMQIWRHTIRELERLLKNYGIFRDVRVWGLISNDRNKIQIRRGVGTIAKTQPARSASELIDASGRRLVLVVSDCVSDPWRNGDVNLVLKTWANNVPTAIIQMLPKWLWARTALGWATEVKFQGLAPAVSNRQLITNRVSLWSEIDEATGIKVPVFTLERNRVANWAQMLVGKGRIQSSGYVFKPEARTSERDKRILNFSQDKLTAEQRVQAFRVTASPMARKLAGLLASAPVVSLPVVRLIRETMLENSQQVHVAEVFLGGLLKLLSEIEIDTEPDYVQYVFIDGVRELLVDSVPSSYVLNVIEEVSKFVAKKIDLSLEDFAAVLRNPKQIEQISDSELAEQVQPFAMVTGQILRRLGGNYAKVAEQLEFSSQSDEDKREEELEELEEIRDEELFELNLLKVTIDRDGQSWTEPQYQLHGLIAEYFRAKLEELEQANELRQKFCRQMIKIARSIPETPTQEDIRRVAIAIPHLSIVAKELTDYVDDEDLIWSFVGLGRFYEGQGAYERAEEWYERSVTVCRNRLGQEHPDVATSINNLAELYRVQGRYERAEPLYVEALEMSKKLLGEKHPDVATSINNLALLYRVQGRYERAEPFYVEALAMRKKLLGEEHPDVAMSLNNLAGLYYSQGRHERAEPFYVEALEMYKKLLGEEHPSVATSINNLAGLYRVQGRYERAEPLYVEALAMRKKLLGEEHPYVATSMNDLALLYDSQGRYEEAEPLYVEALEMSKKLLGEEHPDVATSINNLANLYSSQGRYEEAEPLSVEALEMSKKLLGEEHPDVAGSINNLAALYYGQERYEEAEPLFLQALEMNKKLLGEEHPNVVTGIHWLAFLYHEQGRYSEAEPLYIQALVIAEKVLGKDHPNTKQIRENYQRLLEEKK